MRYGIIGALYLAASGAYASDLTVNLDLPIQNEPVVYNPAALYTNEPAAVPVDVTALPDIDGVAAANVEDYFAEEFDSSSTAVAASATRALCQRALRQRALCQRALRQRAKVRTQSADRTAPPVPST